MPQTTSNQFLSKAGLATQENTLSAKEFTLEELENLSPEDFEKLAAQTAEPTQEQVEPAPKTEAVTPPAAAEEEQEELVYRREIDLGDGSGVQVFEGDSYDELIDKLANAQLHATKKIKELSAARKAEAASEELTPEQEFLLAQELTSKPGKAMKALIESTLGMTVEEFRKTQSELREFRAKQVADSDAVQFVNETPDYYASQRNGAKIQKYLSTYKLQPTIENYKQAFADLNEGGLLEAKPANGASNKQGDPDTRIADDEPTPVVTQRKVGSSISTKGRAASSTKMATLSEADLYDMPLDKLEALARLQA